MQVDQVEMESAEKLSVVRSCDENPVAAVTKSQCTEVNVKCVVNSEISIISVHGEALPAISWDANWAWTERTHRFFLNAAKLQFLLVWSSTLGGAHSALGENFLFHAEEAGAISQCQLVLARKMGDDLLAARSKIFMAYSLLQRSHVHRAGKIVREQYLYLTKESSVRDKQLEAMCQSIWKQLQHLQKMKRLAITSSTASKPSKQAATLHHKNSSSPYATPTLLTPSNDTSFSIACPFSYPVLASLSSFPPLSSTSSSPPLTSPPSTSPLASCSSPPPLASPSLPFSTSSSSPPLASPSLPCCPP